MYVILAQHSVISALEEAILRSTMIWRDTFFAHVLGYEELSAAELLLRRRMWAANAAMTMYTEIVSIVTSRVAYILFRKHRFT